jgi:hypothetical protein
MLAQDFQDTQLRKRRRKQQQQGGDTSRRDASLTAVTCLAGKRHPGIAT